MAMAAVFSTTACGSRDDGAAARAAPPAAQAPTGDRQLPRQIETRVARSLAERYGATVESVRCPESVELAAGSQLPCEAALGNGTSLPIDVELTTTTGDYVAREKPVVLLGKLASVIAERYRARGGPIGNVDCGGAIRVSEPGTTFRCSVSRPGAEPVQVDAEITSWQGRVELGYPDEPDESDEPSAGASIEANAAGSVTP
jgi:hypothetical protein